MKRKTHLLTMLFFFCLLFAISSSVSAGWETQDGIRYYYDDSGKKYTNGPKNIDGALYLFTSDGQLITDTVTLYKNKLYKSRANGKLVTTWTTVDGQKYYGTSKGYLKTGLLTYNNSTYYFDPTDGTMKRNTFVKVGTNQYYMQSTGKAVKNKLVTIQGDKYLFDKNGLLQHGIHKIGDYYYGFGKQYGRMLYGAVKYGKYEYYFNTKTGQAFTNKFKTLNGKKYYYNTLGRKATGWVTISNKMYYMDPNDGGAMTYGKKTINGKTYDFGTKGYVTFSQSSQKVLRVNRKNCVVTVYENNVPVKAITCSVGRADSPTPVGTFSIITHEYWTVLDGPSLGQYCSRLSNPNYLFHSVPMHTTVRNPYKVEASYYNRLGSPASAGCIRVSVADAKWIFYNCPVGSTVVISDNEPMPLGKPATIKMAANSIGKDPTDKLDNPAGYDVSIKK